MLAPDAVTQLRVEVKPFRAAAVLAAVAASSATA